MSGAGGGLGGGSSERLSSKSTTPWARKRSASLVWAPAREAAGGQSRIRIATTAPAGVRRGPRRARIADDSYKLGPAEQLLSGPPRPDGALGDELLDPLAGIDFGRIDVAVRIDGQVVDVVELTGVAAAPAAGAQDLAALAQQG